ncbi:MAG: beta-lactamase family protein [Acidobacteria bacterium]|nr:beta-lactamase family protein [Acidobacteriota bacterium]
MLLHSPERYIQPMPAFADLPPSMLSSALARLNKSVEDHVFPGAVLAIGHRGRLAILTAGKLAYDGGAAPVSGDTIYDLASLTKAAATTTAAMILIDRALFSLDDTVAQHLSEFASANSADLLREARAEVTVRHLLAHTSGLPAYEKFFLRARQKSHVIEEALALPLEEPPGRKTVYSDVGFILLGELLEHVAQEPLDTFCRREIFEPLGMQASCFNPPAGLQPRIAPTEQDDLFRKRMIRGEVQDENAWVMGGVAGHAGLFGTAGDLAAFCQMMLDEGSAGGRQLIQAGTIREFTRPWPAQQGAPRGLGWDKPSEPSSSGRYFSPASYGHLGYTGTSIWIDPEKQLFVILLTNRIHPSRANEAIKQVRPALHDAILEALR